MWASLLNELAGLLGFRFTVFCFVERRLILKLRLEKHGKKMHYFLSTPSSMPFLYAMPTPARTRIRTAKTGIRSPAASAS
jgi:hypothetical protein